MTRDPNTVQSAVRDYLRAVDYHLGELRGLMDLQELIADEAGAISMDTPLQAKRRDAACAVIRATAEKCDQLIEQFDELYSHLMKRNSA